MNRAIMIDELNIDKFTEQEWQQLQKELERIRSLPNRKPYEGCDEHTCNFQHSCN